MVVAFIFGIFSLIKGLSRSEAHQAAHAEFEIHLWNLLTSDHAQSFTARALAEQLGEPEKKVLQNLMVWVQPQLVQHDPLCFQHDRPQYDTFRALVN